jgi:hypothetical protein
MFIQWGMDVSVLYSNSRHHDETPPMSLSRSEISRINRENASHSTGPRTIPGKARSSRNALKHGLRAEKLALPNENPAEFAAREATFRAEYNPQNLTEDFLVKILTKSTIKIDRCERYETSVLDRQVRTAAIREQVRRLDQINSYRALLPTDGPTAVEGLRRSAEGCAYLIGQWTKFRDEIQRTGRLAWEVRRHAGYLGARFSEHIGDGPIESHQSRDAQVLAMKQIASQLEELTARQAELQGLVEPPDSEGIRDRSLMFEDREQGALFLRYEAGAHNLFLRMASTLARALKEQPRAPRTLPEEPETVADPLGWGGPEAEPAVPVPVPPEAPNEPEAPPINPCTETTSEEAPAPRTGFEPGRYLFPPAILDALDSIHAQELIDEQVKAAQAAQNRADQGETL